MDLKVVLKKVLMFFYELGEFIETMADIVIFLLVLLLASWFFKINSPEFYFGDWNWVSAFLAIGLIVKLLKAHKDKKD